MFGEFNSKREQIPKFLFHFVYFISNNIYYLNDNVFKKLFHIYLLFDFTKKKGEK